MVPQSLTSSHNRTSRSFGCEDISGLITVLSGWVRVPVRLFILEVTMTRKDELAKKGDGSKESVAEFVKSVRENNLVSREFALKVVLDMMGPDR